MEIRAFCDEYLHFGEPVTIVSGQVKHYDGEHCHGISLNTVMDPDLMKSHPSFVNVGPGQIVVVGTAGSKIRIPLLTGDIGHFIKPTKNGGWKVTSKRKGKSVGQILKSGEDYCDVVLL